MKVVKGLSSAVLLTLLLGSASAFMLMRFKNMRLIQWL